MMRLTGVQSEDFMRAARSTNVDLEGWSLSLLDTPKRESLAVTGALPRARPNPAPTRERSSVSSQGGSSSSRQQPSSSRHGGGEREERRGSSTRQETRDRIERDGRPKPELHSRQDSRPRAPGTEGDYGHYERRGSRNGIPVNGDRDH